MCLSYVFAHEFTLKSWSKLREKPRGLKHTQSLNAAVWGLVFVKRQLAIRKTASVETNLFLKSYVGEKKDDNVATTRYFLSSQITASVLNKNVSVLLFFFLIVFQFLLHEVLLCFFVNKLYIKKKNNSNLNFTSFSLL